MRLILPSQAQPLTLKGPQLFVDWRFVSEGEVNWLRDGTAKTTNWGDGSGRIVPRVQVPTGIRLEGVKAEVVGPMLPQTLPWELGYLMYLNTIIKENGTYRMWYTVVPDDFAYNKDLKIDVDVGWVLCYAESQDGINWVKPQLGLAQFEGQETNWVYGRHLSPNAFASGSVFKDPNAPPAERYKLIYRGEIATGDIEEFKKRQKERFGSDMDPKALKGKPGKPNTCATTSGAVSPDGIHWTPLAEPIMMYCSDQMNTAFWDPDLKKYVGYFRMERAGRRSVGRSETEDFRKWPTPTPCLEIAPEWGPAVDIMHCPGLKYPGMDNLWVMLATLFHRSSDCRDVQLAVSADSLYWNWLPGGPQATRDQAVGDWRFDEVEAGHALVELPGDRLGLPVVTYEFPYKYPRSLSSGPRKARPFGEAGYAVWKRDRLCAVVADEFGQFTTPALIVAGRQLSFNLKTEGHAGHVTFELRDRKGTVLPGRSFAECDPLSGDSLDMRVSWKGNADLSDLAGEAVVIAVKIHMGRLFAFQWIA